MKVISIRIYGTRSNCTLKNTSPFDGRIIPLFHELRSHPLTLVRSTDPQRRSRAFHLFPFFSLSQFLSPECSPNVFAPNDAKSITLKSLKFLGESADRSQLGLSPPLPPPRVSNRRATPIGRAAR
ncbi:hypothetical protein K0M31_006352 [Melipona bicolor]|uniref:Uncharacterized protein n=1 Tax=Melipona bicolor TaxID=60889 RepID=A0AA40FTE0_9HYME|nr:hypothetical protein K0M31_006352 [Melipona bicolor]